MNGHLPLIAMREQGAVPAVVWLETNPEHDPCCDDWLDISPDHAHLQLDQNECPARADLRCVVGLMVSISGSDLKRVRATRDACVAAGAKRVIAATTKRIGRGESQEHEVVEITDTAGFLTHETPLEVAR